MKRRDWAAQLVIFAATVLAFLPVLRNDFVNWDDGAFIISNPAARGLGWLQLKWGFSHYVSTNFAPLTWLSYGLDYRFWGLDPRGYHLTNLLLHAINALLFYRLAKALIGLSRPSGARRESDIVWPALFSALFFAVHPLRVESVAWATERRDVLSGLFYLCTLLLYLRAAMVSSENKSRGRRYLIASFFAYALSLLSKCMGITLPAVLILLDVYPLRRIRGVTDLRWELLAEKLPYAALAAAAAFIGFKGQSPDFSVRYSLPARFVQALFGPSFYLWKTVWPFRLSPIYELPLQFHPLAFPYSFGALVTVFASAVLWLRRRTWPGALAVWIFFIVTLLPVSGLVPIGLQFAADRYTYLSTLGFALLAGGALMTLRDASARSLPSVLISAAILASLGALTWRQARIWRNSESLWTYALPLAPDSNAAHSGMADVLRDQGRLDEAVVQYREALRINPKRPQTQNNFGMALVARGDVEEGIEHYRTALSLWPADWPGGAVVHNNLGLALAKQEKIQEAAGEFGRAVVIDPDYAEAHGNLGVALAESGRLSEAIVEYREGLRLDPNNVDAACGLGLALAAQGKWEEADADFRRALAASPDPARLYERLLLALRGQGAGAGALSLFRKNVAVAGRMF